MRTLTQSTWDGNHVYDINIGEDGDFLFTNPDNSMEAYGNIIADATRTLEGELQLDTERGIPYQRTIWQSSKNLAVWEIFMREVVSKYSFVVNIEDFTMNIDGNGALTYTMTILTDDGTVEVSS